MRFGGGFVDKISVPLYALVILRNGNHGFKLSKFPQTLPFDTGQMDIVMGWGKCLFSNINILRWLLLCRNEEITRW